MASVDEPVGGGESGSAGESTWTHGRLLVALMLLVYWSAAFVATHVPSGQRTGESGEWFPHFDKVAHFMLYFGLSFLLCWSLTLGRRSYLAAAGMSLVAVLVYAILDELLQELIPRRTASVWDWGADMVGGVVGITVFCLCWRWLRSVSKR